MTFYADIAGDETSIPRLGIEFILPVVTYRLATGTRDITIGGARYTAWPSQVGEVQVQVANQSSDLIIKIPVAHPIAQRYMASGIPPRTIYVNVWHQQQTSGEHEGVWRGRVTSMAIEGHDAIFRVPSAMGETMEMRIPTISVGRQCPHVLYDENCKVVRADYLIAATVTHIAGTDITVSTDDGNSDRYLRYGELKHIATGERMSIHEHIGLVVTIQLPIVGMKVGDTIELYPGCAHDVNACAEFDNILNYGGFPQLPSGNVFWPNGYGTIVQI